MKAVDRLCSHFLLFLWLLMSGSVLQTASLGVGINYGQIADNLPSPIRVAGLLRSINISRVKLYDSDQNVLTAFLNTNVEFIIGIGNENVLSMMDFKTAQAWLQQHVKPYIPNARITCITLGNEVFSGNDTSLMVSLLPAMQSVYQALVSLGLEKKINVTTVHSLNILGNSFPPSSGSFRGDLAEYFQSLLNFHAMTKSPFLINAYPYFAYKADPNSISLPYVLFEPNPGVIDPITKLNYDNMLYAQIDSIYSAIKAMGHTDVDVRVSETGWPSKGDPGEFGATPENAAIYNGNLLQRISMNQGTPLMPSLPIDIHVFALFNENLKPGPTSERNYGLFYPDGTQVYNIGLEAGHLPGMSTSSSFKHGMSGDERPCRSLDFLRRKKKLVPRQRHTDLDLDSPTPTTTPASSPATQSTPSLATHTSDHFPPFYHYPPSSSAYPHLLHIHIHLMHIHISSHLHIMGTTTHPIRHLIHLLLHLLILLPAPYLLRLLLHHPTHMMDGH